MWNWKNGTDECICKVEILRCGKQMYEHQGGKGGNELGDRNWHIHTTMYKIDN